MAIKAAQTQTVLNISLFSTLIVLYSHLVASKGTTDGSLGGLKTDLQRQIGDLFLKS